MKPVLHTHTTVGCPHCNKDSGHMISHLFNRVQADFGPWWCKQCGKQFHGTVNRTDVDVSIEPMGPTIVNTLALLCRDGPTPLWFVVEGTHYPEQKGNDEELQRSQEYFYESHSCPTNWIGDTVLISEGGNTDPHGCLRFVRSIPVPHGYNPSEEEIAAHFPEMNHAAIPAQLPS